MTFEEYIHVLKTEEEEASCYLGCDKDKEIAYMEDHRYRFEQVANSIGDSSDPISILDIGTTPFTMFIKAAHPHYEVASLDRTNLMEDRCRAKGIQLKVCNLDDEPMPFEDDCFDVVVFTEVLEHIFAPPSDILKEVRRIMRVGGKLILSVPNIAVLSNRIKLLVGITPLPNPDGQMKKGWVHGHGHVHEYTMKEIASLLTACGFAVSRKRFLQASVFDAFKGWREKGVSALVKGSYHTARFLMPSTRPVIYLECRRL